MGKWELNSLKIEINIERWWCCDSGLDVRKSDESQLDGYVTMGHCTEEDMINTWIFSRGLKLAVWLFPDGV